MKKPTMTTTLHKWKKYTKALKKNRNTLARQLFCICSARGRRKGALSGLGFCNADFSASVSGAWETKRSTFLSRQSISLNHYTKLNHYSDHWQYWDPLKATHLTKPAHWTKPLQRKGALSQATWGQESRTRSYKTYAPLPLLLRLAAHLLLLRAVFFFLAHSCEAAYTVKYIREREGEGERERGNELF
jgi:hypothetical protein